MIRRFVADLHVHSLLSPCAEVEMTPRNIVWHAAENGIDIVAITDHNAGDNVRAAMEAAKSYNVTVLPGMEVETREEIHFVALFEKPRQLAEWVKIVDAHRPGLLNNADKFGAQFVVDAEDNLVSIKEEMLLAPLTISLAQACETVTGLGGLCIASHVDRQAYSILYKLGFIPPGLQLAALEISARTNPEDARRRFPVLDNWQLIRSSDAHTMDDFIGGPKTVFCLDQPTLPEIRQALYRENSREVVL